MPTDFIIVSEYCRKANIDPSFIVLLEENGLITLYIEKGERYLPASQLISLEKYARMYYDLSINIEGIDAIRHMLNKIEELQNEINILRSKIRSYEPGE